MSIDVKSLQSLQAIIGANNMTDSARATLTPHFSDFLMQAFDQSRESKKSKDNGLYTALSGNVNRTAMQNMLGLGHSSMLTSYLQSSDAVHVSNPFVSSDTPKTTEIFSSYLQSSAQTKLDHAMNSAKTKLQHDMEQFRAQNDTNSAAVKLRLQQMEQNIATVSSFTTRKSNHTTNDQLLQLLNTNGANNKFLFNL